jgi:hypothetical protein
LFEIAEITFAPKRWPVPVPATSGVCPTGRPGAAGAVVGAQAHLVGPEDQRPSPAGAPLQLRVALLQPARHQLRVALERTPGRLLRAEPPDAQIPPRRLLGDREPEPALDQLADERPRPQEARQPELIGILLPDRLRDLRLLPRREHRLLALAPAPRTRRQRLLAAAPMRSNPLVHRLPRHIQKPRHLSLRPSLPNKRDRAPTQLLLRRLRQPPRVPRPHTPDLTNPIGCLPSRSSKSL